MSIPRARGRAAVGTKLMKILDFSERKELVLRSEAPQRQHRG